MTDFAITAVIVIALLTIGAVLDLPYIVLVAMAAAIGAIRLTLVVLRRR